MTVEYDGVGFHGFQRQRIGSHPEQDLRTVQGVLEAALASLSGERVHVTGAGRTDAGVHALGQVVNCFTSSRIPIDRFAQAMNTRLPPDLVVRDAQEAESTFHARFDAVAKVYCYAFYCRRAPSPFWRRYSLFVPQPLRVEAMRTAAKHLVGTHDFSSFQAAGSAVQSPVRTMSRCTVIQRGELVFLWVKADGFLYNMVRIIAGTLLEVGLGRRHPNEVQSVLMARTRSAAGPTAPAHGLCLVRVVY